MKKLLKVLLWIVVAVAAIPVAVWLFATIKYADFFGAAQQAFPIPGLSDGVVPQGFYRLEEEELFLMTGYMADGSASRNYVRTDRGEIYYVNLQQEDGTPYTDHSGGVCANGEYVYVAGETGVDVFLLKDVLEQRDAKLCGTVKTGFQVAFCEFYNGYLMAGNFYYPEAYETPQEHRLQTPAGDQNYGIIALFPQSNSEVFGIDPTPVAALSIPEKVQGVTVLEDQRLILSTSYGLNSSGIFVHKFDPSRSGTMQVLDTTVPLYYLDSATLEKSYTLPPMSEELAVMDGKVYVLFESASTKYKFGHLIRGTDVYTIVP